MPLYLAGRLGKFNFIGMESGARSESEGDEKEQQENRFYFYLEARRIRQMEYLGIRGLERATGRTLRNERKARERTKAISLSDR
jgi:hypothetical protein